MTEEPKDSVYSSVVSLPSLRLLCFMAELNGLILSGADIGNADLDVFTKEEVCFIAGPEFGPLAGHTMKIVKALYGLRSSGARFHDCLADTLRELGFTPTFANPDVWIRDAKDCYEYICCYVDDLLAALKNPKEFWDKLQSLPYSFKLKGGEEPKYHLGANFFQDSDGVLALGTQMYVRRLSAEYVRLFGKETKTYMSALPRNDHPELDASPSCGPDDTKKFQSLIGALQWTISLCHLDIACAVMTLERYRVDPHVGHLTVPNA